jgi:hypothetical protein
METLEDKRGEETMLKRIKGAELETIRTFAKEIVNAIAEGQYGLIPQKLDDMGGWDIEFLSQTIESFKSDNGYEHIDGYDVPCTYSPQYANGSLYTQEDIFEYVGGGSYGIEYALTTDGQPNDLTLQMKFDLVSDSEIKVIFESGICVL